MRGAASWLEQAPFDDRDLARPLMHRSQLSGASAETPLIVVARSACEVDDVTAFGPEAMLNAWRDRSD